MIVDWTELRIKYTRSMLSMKQPGFQQRNQVKYLCIAFIFGADMVAIRDSSLATLLFSSEAFSFTSPALCVYTSLYSLLVIILTVLTRRISFNRIRHGDYRVWKVPKFGKFGWISRQKIGINSRDKLHFLRNTFTLTFLKVLFRLIVFV